jgi:hypothetical protein
MQTETGEKEKEEKKCEKITKRASKIQRRKESAGYEDRQEA